MTGDVPDMQARLRALLPPWFPNIGSAPVVDGVLTGIATVLSLMYGLIAYARSQTRIRTAFGGFLDLIAWDFFGGRFTRFPGESDPAFLPRLLKELTRRRVTRAAIISALQDATGFPVRLIEPGVMTDNGFWKVRGGAVSPVSFYRVDTPSNPARWSSRGLRCQFFVECTLPLQTTFGNNPMPAWGVRGAGGSSVFSAFWMLRGTAGALKSASSWLSRSGASTGGEAFILSLLNAMRAAGVICWVKFVPVPTQVKWDQPGVHWDQGASWDR